MEAFVIMKESKLSKSVSKRSLRNTQSLHDNKSSINNHLEKEIKKWKNEASILTYEESLNLLDSLLENLQNDSVPLDELQEYHLKGSIYLEHCQQLLRDAEQQVIEIDSDTLEE